MGASSQKGFNTQIAAPEYRKAFVERGLDLVALEPGEAGRRLAVSAVKVELVAAVVDWALYEPDEAVRDRLLQTKLPPVDVAPPPRDRKGP